VPFAYYQRLSRRERAIYRRSDAVPALRVPGVSGLHPAVETLRRALETGEGEAVARASFAITAGLSRALGAAPPRLEIHAVRPRGETHELHGLYVPEGEEPPVIRVWMRTARHGRVVAFRTFLRTLLHELVHHLDFEVLELEWSFHTEGFFQRESSLFRQLVPESARAPSKEASSYPRVHPPPMDPKDTKGGQAGKDPTARRDEDVGADASGRQQEIGPSGGPPSDADRQWRGATPTEDVMDRVLRERKPGERTPEKGEPDSGVGDPGDLE
jgi:hypothetical protein